MSRRTAPFVIRIPKGIVLSIAILVVALAALEIRQRVVESSRRAERAERPYSLRGETRSGTPLTDEGGQLAIRHAPHLVYAMRPNQTTPTATVNAQGFRGADWTPRPPAGTRRLIVLGGSAAFGVGASGDDAVFTAVLERAMRADGQRVEVLNAGVIGYDATQEFVLLATVLLDYRPDAILLFDGWNDFYISGTSPPGADALMNLTFREIDELLEARRRTLANLVSGSALLRRAIRRPAAWRRKGAPRRFGTYADNEALALPRYRTALQRACRLAKAYDVAVILAPQPELFCRGGTIPADERALRATHEESGYADLSRAQYRHFVDVAAAVAREEGTHYLDCTTAFDALEHGCFTDFVHLNDRGNTRLAACLRPVVERALLRP